MSVPKKIMNLNDKIYNDLLQQNQRQAIQTKSIQFDRNKKVPRVVKKLNFSQRAGHKQMM